MQKLLLISVLLLAVATINVRPECVEGKMKHPIDSEDGDMTVFFKNVGCTIQEGATKVQEGAEELGVKIKEGANSFKDTTKEFGSDVKTKFEEIKDKITASSEETSNPLDSLLESPDSIDPEILKDEQKCDKGFILDTLGGCKKN